MFVFCSQCGASNPDDQRFCGSCGRELARPADAAPSPGSSPPGTPAAAYVGILLQHGGVGNQIIARVDPSSPAERAGLRAGDVILRADGGTFASDAALGEYLRSKKPGDSIRFEVWSNGAKKLVTIWQTEPAARPSTESQASIVSPPTSEAGAPAASGGRAALLSFLGCLGLIVLFVIVAAKVGGTLGAVLIFFGYFLGFLGFVAGIVIMGTQARRAGILTMGLSSAAFIGAFVAMMILYSNPAQQATSSNPAQQATSSNPAQQATSAPRSAAWNHKAVQSESKASALVGGFSESERQKYHLGLQHIANTHANVSAYTIAQVVDKERAREVERQAVADRKVEAAQQAAAAREQEAQAALFHGTPDCLVFDTRTLKTESGDYTWYIEGKVINKCDHDLSYAQIEFSFYDSSGNKVASGMDNINNLVAGQTWSFKKSVYETTTSGTFRVTGLSGF